jgi:hypothetical protein
MAHILRSAFGERRDLIVRQVEFLRGRNSPSTGRDAVITCDKLAERALLALLLMPVAWFAYVALSFAWASMALERFYRDRPILQAMRMAHDDPPSVESAAAAEALLRYVPLGTDATAAIAIL